MRPAQCGSRGATDSNDVITKWSNYGPKSVDVAAPGLDAPCGGGFCLGTSFSSPNVAGVAALLKSKNPGMTPSEVRQVIVDSAESKPSLQGKMVSNGRANAVRALDRVPPTATAPKGGLMLGSTMPAGDNPTVPVTFSWSGGNGTGGSGVAGYEVERSANGGAFEPVALPSGMATSVRQDLSPAVSYEYRVRAVDVAGNVGEWVSKPFQASPRQESHSAIAYAGAWVDQSALAFYGGASRHANDAGDRATLTFKGTEVAWVASEGTNRGRAEVYVDGKLVKTLSLYEESVVHRKAVFVSVPADLDPTRTSHTIRVKVLGTKQAVSSGTRVDVDAFLVVP